MEPNSSLCSCIHCGKPISGDDIFCINCGKKIEPPAPPKPVCSACGASLNDGDLFCINCGTKVTLNATPVEPALPPVPSCPSCGAAVSEDDLFCIHCGAELQTPPQPKVTPAPEEPTQDPDPEPVPEPQPIPEPAPAPVFTPAPTPVMRKRSKNIPIALGCLSAALLIAAGIFLIPKNSSEPGKSSGTQKTGNVSTPELPAANTAPSNTDDNISPKPDNNTENPDQTTAPLSYADLYIGTWAAEGTSVYDTANGWRALYLLRVEGETLTFSLEWVHGAPGSTRIFTDPITVTPVNGKASFPVTDNRGNKGTGSIAFAEDTIHITVDITEPAQGAVWSIATDTVFAPDPIRVKVAGNLLTLPQEPYLSGSHIMFPMREVFRSAGIAYLQDGNMTIGLTGRDTLLLEWYADESPLVCFNGMYFDSVPFEKKDGIVFASAAALKELFDLNFNWDAEEKLLTVSNTVAKKLRISSEAAAALEDFTADDAAAQVQQAGYTLSDAGNICDYDKGKKTWFIAIHYGDNTAYVSVTFDGESYTLGTPTDSEGAIISDPQPTPETNPPPEPEPEPETGPTPEPDPAFPLNTPVPLDFIVNDAYGSGAVFRSFTAEKSEDGLVEFVLTFELTEHFNISAYCSFGGVMKWSTETKSAAPGDTLFLFTIPVEELSSLEYIQVLLIDDSEKAVLEGAKAYFVHINTATIQYICS